MQELVTSAPMAEDSHRKEVGRWGDSFFLAQLYAEEEKQPES